MVDEGSKLPRRAGMLKFANRLLLDLANPLAGDGEYPTNLLERICIAIGQPVSQPKDLPLAVIKRL
jgi:hypothetical protein